MPTKTNSVFGPLASLVLATLVAALALSGVASAATAPLAVTKIVPASAAAEVSRTANVEAYFDHDMRASSITSSTFKIRKKGTTTWLGASRSVDNTISPTSTNGGSQSVATLDPDANLAANTTYRVVVVGGSSGVKNLNGDALGANKSWTFTTVTPPETTINSGLSGIVPTNSAGFSFSSSKPNSTFKCSIEGSAFAACSSPVDYPGPFGEGGPHTFRVRAIDATGTPDPTPARRSWTVDTIQPTITDFTPAEGGVGVPSTNVTATFSEAMDPSTISDQMFTLKQQGATTPLGATVTYAAATKTATLDPSTDLAPSTTYVVTVTDDARDLASLVLAHGYSWTFTVQDPGCIISCG